MTIRRDSGLSESEQHEASKRLTARFTPWSQVRLSDVDALSEVAIASREITRGNRPEATEEDCLDALALAGPARFALDVSELKVMAHARHRHGVTWERIGQALGYGTETGPARQGARARYAALAKRYPWVIREIKAEQEGDQE